jgi:hypothetical protein
MMIQIRVAEITPSLGGTGSEVSTDRSYLRLLLATSR